MEFKQKLKNYLSYYLTNNELIIEFLTLFGMVIHIYFYQRYEKQTELNTYTFKLLIIDFIYLIIINDVFFTSMKYFSKCPEAIKYKKIIISLICFLIFQIFLNFKILSNIAIESYYLSYFFFKFLWIISNLLKSFAIFIKSKFVADLIKLIDTIWVINMLLISLTDSLINNELAPNQVCFYEIYFRYIEYHNLILALYLIYHDRNIENEINTKTYTTSAIIGKYDSFRFTVILILTHYYFVLINGLAFSPKYFLGFSSLFIAFYSISSYRQRRMNNLYLSFALLLSWNLCTYLIALLYSVSPETPKSISLDSGMINSTINLTNHTI